VKLTGPAQGNCYNTKQMASVFDVRYISETVQESAKVTTESEYEVIRGLSNDVIPKDRQ